MTEATKFFIKTLLFLAAVGILSLSAAYFVGVSLCPVYNLFGIPCLSCGMTRAWSSALRGDLAEAIAYHPMFWIVILLPFMARKDNHVNVFAVMILMLLIIVWIVRMIYLFPYTEPMTINDHALVFKVFFSNLRQPSPPI